MDRSDGQEFVDYPYELARALPEERVVCTVDNDKPRAGDAVVEHLRTVTLIQIKNPLECGSALVSRQSYALMPDQKTTG